jgi:uncharacterized protein (UPF0332 family)
MYYSAFQTVTALLIIRGDMINKHTHVRGFVNKELALKGFIDKNTDYNNEVFLIRTLLWNCSKVSRNLNAVTSGQWMKEAFESNEIGKLVIEHGK